MHVEKHHLLMGKMEQPAYLSSSGSFKMKRSITQNIVFLRSIRGTGVSASGVEVGSVTTEEQLPVFK